MTDRLVQFLADTDFDNHIRYISRKIPKLIELVPLQMMTYLDKRIRTTTWVEGYTRGRVQHLDDCDFNMCCEDMWSEHIEKEISDNMFEEDLIEAPLTMKILDFPSIAKFNSDCGTKLLEVLAATENDELFENKSLRAIIEYKFPVVKAAILRNLFIPYLILLFSFMIYSIWSYEYLESEEGKA